MLFGIVFFMLLVIFLLLLCFVDVFVLFILCVVDVVVLLIDEVLMLVWVGGDLFVFEVFYGCYCVWLYSFLL